MVLCEIHERFLKEMRVSFKASLTLNDFYDTTCMTPNRFSNFHCVYATIQVVHTEFIKVVLQVFSLQELKQNDSRTSRSSNSYCSNFREKQVKENRK